MPSGVETGTRIQLRGEGEVGEAGGPAGDLFVELSVNDHETFARSGDDLVTTLAVPMTSAALGAT
ncbi:DnaJ C-terminal domain-containing protein, partial [Pseudonocardia dioxanivorans]|uniref:DnaJ C-terminal domain-containing protein n=1 Tax=Pseudonocardia dioxanivorans TaxID=240495 RepID=UPI0039891223